MRIDAHGLVATIICYGGGVTILVLALIGYIMNIMEVCHLTTFPLTALVRIIGIFIPFVGAIAGYIN